MSDELPQLVHSARCLVAVPGQFSKHQLQCFLSLFIDHPLEIFVYDTIFIFFLVFPLIAVNRSIPIPQLQCPSCPFRMNRCHCCQDVDCGDFKVWPFEEFGVIVKFVEERKEKALLGQQLYGLLGVAKDEAVRQNKLVLQLGRRCSILNNVSDTGEQRIFKIEQQVVPNQIWQPSPTIIVQYCYQFLILWGSQFQIGNNNIPDQFQSLAINCTELYQLLFRQHNSFIRDAFGNQCRQILIVSVSCGYLPIYSLECAGMGKCSEEVYDQLACDSVIDVNLQKVQLDLAWHQLLQNASVLCMLKQMQQELENKVA